MRKVCALLYYVHITTYNQIDCKRSHVLIINFYRLVRFHIQRRFCISLSFRVSNSGQPVIYAKNIVRKIPVTNCTAAYQQYLHGIINFYINLPLFGTQGRLTFDFSIPTYTLPFLFIYSIFHSTGISADGDTPEAPNPPPIGRQEQKSRA